MDVQQHSYEDLPTWVRELIARQEQEIEVLKQRLEREQFARELRQVLVSADAISTILTPFSYEHLLEMVVQTAAAVIHAQSGSLFLLDEQSNELIFEVAIGPVAQEVKKFRVPVGHGIVGMVVLTGQPMAVAQADQDERQAHDIASAVNYIPENILCVPLFYDDRIIGAIELLNKTDTTSFSPKDMETLGLFASIAAFAIAQSQAYHRQNTVQQRLLASLREADASRRQELYRQALAFSAWVDQEDILSSKVQKLAQLLHELIATGDQEIDLCTSIIQSFVTSVHSRSTAPMLRRSV